MGFTTVKDIWLDINERFGQSNRSKHIQLQKELAATSQGSSDIGAYFTKLRCLWDELSTAYVGLVCTCGALPKHIEEHKIFQFLGGLNESYSTCKSNILMKSSLPSVSKAYSMLQHDEKQKETPSPFPSFSNEVASFSVSSSPSNSNSNRSVNHRIQFDSRRVPTSSLSCKYCKKPGYSIEKCYMLHGFPPEFKFIKNNRFVSCVQSEGYNVDSLRFGGSVRSVSKSSDVPVHGFSKEQYQHLINLFQQSHISLPFQSEGSSGENAAFANFAVVMDILKGPSLRRPLEIGKAANGLYYLNPTTTTPSLSIPFTFSHCNVSNSVSSCTVSNHQLLDMAEINFILELFLVFVFGVPFWQKGYKLLNVHTHSIIFARDVVFHEHIFPYNRSFSPTFSLSSTYVDSPSPPPSTSSIPTSSTSQPLSTSSFPPVSLAPAHSSPDPILRRSSRTVTQPAYLVDYICSSVLPHSAPVSMNSKISSAELHMHKPQFYQHVASHLAWKEAMLKEFQALEANQTWDIVLLPPHKKPIPYK
ncbi:uncharacterized protein [Nicotiana tomentosiformis]|uniref:uncharacterized protein n=1 Tax=Nicotiana tomentosiformis TaxID=4098 RepID=UPI00388C7501